MKLNVKTNETMLRQIVWAVEKGIGPDVREFMQSNDMVTYNSLRIIRSDKINTNLRSAFAVGPVELKCFNRYGWTGALLIDRENLVTFTICTERTLREIPLKKDRNIPHYLQTILYVQNASVKGAQMSMPEVEQLSLFSDDVYQEDYKRIMDDDVSFDDGYTHYCVTYDAVQGEIQFITLRLLDRNFRNAEVYSLNEYLLPDFSDLTAEDEQPQNKDARSLVSVKAGLKSEDSFETQAAPQVATIKMEDQRQA